VILNAKNRVVEGEDEGPVVVDDPSLSKCSLIWMLPIDPKLHSALKVTDVIREPATAVNVGLSDEKNTPVGVAAMTEAI